MGSAAFVTNQFIFMAERINSIVIVQLLCPLLVKIAILTEHSASIFLSQFVLTSDALITDHVVILKGMVNIPSDNNQCNI